MTIDRKTWRQITDRYRTPSDAIAFRQVASCVLPLVALWLVMIASLRLPYVVTLLLCVVSSLFFIRLFMLQHDCGHGSLFKTPWLNDVVGIVICFPLLTPYWEWRKSHAIHHGITSQLENRILNDIYTMTVAEWQRAPTWQRIGYRIFRSVPVLMGIAPTWTFVISNRIKGSMCKGLPRGRNLANVVVSTVVFAAFAFGMSRVIGWDGFLKIQAPILVFGGMIGIWIFYMEHNFEQTWWSEQKSWTHEDSALRGSSFCVMPRWFAWCLADVGFHHVHHLDTRIPNYRLRACHDENPALFSQVPPVTIGDTLYALWTLRLYDERIGRLVPFSAAVERDTHFHMHAEAPPS
jgi:omega-6 fatty acid desaturase (delta-12 desaturase)